MKIIKRKKRRLSSVGKKIVALFFLLPIYALFSVFFNTINTKMTMDIQKMEKEIKCLEEENAQLEKDIQVLKNRSNVLTIAKESGLQENIENVYYVK